VLSSTPGESDWILLEELDDILRGAALRREPLPFEAGFLAGKAYMAYRRRGGTKRSPVADIYIGAHATIAGHRLLTRDTDRYRSYFPQVDLISPKAG